MTVLGQHMINIGMNIGLNSITLIQVPANPDRFLEDDQLFWTLAVTTLGALTGCLMATPLAPVLGMRRLLLLACPLSALGSLACSFGGDFWWILIGRIVMQISLGMGEGTVRGYVAEISPSHLRAIYATCLNCMVLLGHVLALLLGQLLSWRKVFAITGFVPPAICLVGMLFLPDSPTWLLTRGASEEKACKSLRFFRNTDANVASDVTEIAQSLRETEAASDQDMPSTWRLLLQRETRTPLLMACTQVVVYVWCGGGTLMQITAFVFHQLNVPLSEYQTGMLPPLVSLLAAMFTGPVLERCGRLAMLKIGGAIMFTGGAAIATYSFLSSQEQHIFGWVVLAGAALLQAAHAGIIGPITFNYCGELLPNRTRALGANVVIAALNINYSVLLRVYPYLEEFTGHGGAFTLHALVSLFQILFASCCLKETKGMTLEQVQRIFQRANGGISLEPRTV